MPIVSRWNTAASEMRARMKFVFGLFALAALLHTPAAHAGIVAPSDLQQGDHFRLVFVTSSTMLVQSSNISDYDKFVAGVASSAGLGTYDGKAVTWLVLGSTSTVDAVSRVPKTSAAIYLLNGVKVADSGADLWDGTILAPINLDEKLRIGPGKIATGTNPDGTRSATMPLGPTQFIEGLSLTTDSTWISVSFAAPKQPFPFYAISEELTVAVPEPASMCLVSLLVAAVATISSRKFPQFIRGRASSVQRVEA